MVDGDDVRAAAAACGELLSGQTGQRWDGPVPDLDMTVEQVVAHMAQCCLWYTVDLTAAGRPFTVIAAKVTPDGPPAELAGALDVGATLLAQTVDAAPPERRGFHPFGQADRSGFAAMGCDELLVHAYDVAQALGVSWEPDDALAARVSARLFPWAPNGFDGWSTLLWCNGRRSLGPHGRVQRWRWHCAPLGEWDGVQPGNPRRTHSSQR